MNHGTILGHCVNVLDTYNKEMFSVEEHVNKYLKQQNVSTVQHTVTSILRPDKKCLVLESVGRQIFPCVLNNIVIIQFLQYKNAA